MEKIDRVMTDILGPSWRTTIIGIASILGAISDVLIGWANNKMPNLQADAAAFWGGIGLIFAKDRNVSNAGNPVEARKIVTSMLPKVDHE